jgi:hypothetical protein
VWLFAFQRKTNLCLLRNLTVLLGRLCTGRRKGRKRREWRRQQEL